MQVGLENGVRYPLAARHRGIDPWLFLDLRAARKWVLDNSDGMEVLNLFSYTGGIAAAAACGRAASVWNVHFSASAHEVGRASLKLNVGSAGECKCEWMKRDVLPTIRQLASTPTKDYRADRGGYANPHSRGGGQRGGRGSGGRSNGYGDERGGRSGGEQGRGGGEEKDLKAKQSDLVFLDPPTWSKSKHGAVDLVRDYQALFKPSLLATKEGGVVLATSNVSTVDCAEWVENLSNRNNARLPLR
ncbi:conserved unknown protein [Ectocarpus siliculosus]|uniref:S-adenosylmethionine-dependent methyltransferase domain-containing protein n=1 Tax=Ectocarpus siliculosus TaxID=2880 RepID=D7G8S1_ECTSI|nr:conserved unknown protein [Ectocarpus siliculosus]|eukprot:CBJ28095.1 conserved unknown protein [Ectocarpus siliculosus]